MKTLLPVLKCLAAILAGHILFMDADSYFPSLFEILLFFIIAILGILQLTSLYSLMFSKRTVKTAFLPALYIGCLLAGIYMSSLHLDWQIQRNQTKAKDMLVSITPSWITVITNYRIAIITTAKCIPTIRKHKPGRPVLWNGVAAKFSKQDYFLSPLGIKVRGVWPV